MRYIYVLVLIVTSLVITSCGGDKPARPEAALTADRIAQQNAIVDVPEIPSGGVTGGVKHYICPNGHEGSDAQGSCLVCGTALEHNQAWHNQQPAAAGGDTPPAEPPQNAAGVWHYTCPNGHEGGSGSATPCAVCGTVLVHNQVYHAGDVTTTPTDPLATTAAPPVTPSEPPQNAAGVWHYTCPNGHAGGGGSATPCGECGTTLVHNTAYHN